MSIRLENVSHTYGKGTPFEQTALEPLSLEIKEGEFVGIIGHTGSGKSTLVQLLNGLLQPTEGTVHVDGINIAEKSKEAFSARRRVGMVFQYPEYQLFETDVLRDVMFGPKNEGFSDEEAEEMAKEALRRVGLPEEIWEKSPFEISGGQKRRAAIAGVLAMRPEVLILDEPTAGLDPAGREDLFRQIDELHRVEGMTILLVSHSMDDVARYAEQVLVLSKGELKMSGSPEEIFSHIEALEEMGLGAPQMSYLIRDMRRAGYALPGRPDTVEEAAEAILSAYREGERNA